MSSNNALKNIAFNYAELQLRHNYIIDRLSIEFHNIPIRNKINEYTEEFSRDPAIIEQLNKIKQSGGRKNKKTKHNKKRRRKRKTKKHTK